MKIRYFFLLLGVLLTACNKLDLVPRDKYSTDILWRNDQNVKLYLNSFYTVFRDYGAYGARRSGIENSGNIILSDGLSDILKYSSNVPGNGSTNMIALNPEFITPTQNPLSVWNDAYVRIRRVNEFLYDLEKHEGEVQSGKADQYAAEARFFRAYLYYLITRNHGTAVLLDEPTSNKDHARSSESECWEFIAKDLDFAATHLPVRNTSDDEGRMTKGAALALKSRVMLYAYRWDDVIAAGEQVVSSGVYKLLNDYGLLFKNSKNNSEAIIEYKYMRPDFTHLFDLKFVPSGDKPSLGGQAGPTQELVDSYSMADGESFNWNNPVHAANPYLNREVRFYASILYNGAEWKGRKIETFVGGKDGFVEYASSQDPNTTVTGYYIRKLLDESNIDFQTNKSEQSWIELRYAEVLLNLAEAYAEKGDLEKAQNALNQVRKRSKQPEYRITDKASFMSKLMNERKIELAFEGHRYWDLRRWKLASKVLNGTRVHGAKITRKNDGSFSYEIVDADKRNRFFPEKYYKLPIPASEISNNKLITQIDYWK